MNKRGTALLLTPVLPDPFGSGPARRAFQWVVELGKDQSVDVHVVVFESRGNRHPGVTRNQALPSYLQGRVTGLASVYLIPHKNLWATIVTALLPPIVHWWRGGVDEWLPALPGGGLPVTSLPDTEPISSFTQTHFDRIVVFRFYLHDAASSLRTVGETAGYRELDLDDLESTTRWSMARAALRRGRIRSLATLISSAMQYALLERKFLPKYRRIWLAAEEDRGELAGRYGDAIVSVMPNRLFVDPAMEVTRNVDYQPPFTFLFVGTLGYLPNEDAAVWIARQIQSRIRARLQAPFRIIIAGRGARPHLVRLLERAPGIEFLGEVPSVSGLYADAHVAIAPIRNGGGTKFKLLESFYLECPSVATFHAARGLGAQPGVQYLHAETADEFAAGCVRLVQDETLRQGMVERAKQLALAHFVLREQKTSPRD